MSRTTAMSIMLVALLAAALAYLFENRSGRAPTSIAHSEAGATFELYDVAAGCKGRAHRARFVPPDGGDPIEGCWKWITSGHVQIAFVDGDMAFIRGGLFHAPGAAKPEPEPPVREPSTEGTQL